jgi:peptidoglycan hydrolase FlgJ
MIGTTPDLGASLSIQSNELDRLRTQAAHAPEKAVKGAAQQFEALFLNTLLKSMRDASAGDGLFDSEQTKLYTSMLDQQFAQTLSKRGIGLADMMVKQLSQQAGGGADSPVQKPALGISVMGDDHPLPSPLPLRERGHSPSPLTGEGWDGGEPQRPRPYGMAVSASPIAEKATPQAFVEKLAPHARQVAAELGIPDKFLLGHAALESGWGRREPRFADGSSSHNLFGIKADRSWQGPVVEVTTTEYVNGRREVVKDQFRAYASYADSLRDYADFLRSNPRYAQVLEGQHDAVSFARSLQRAGYATDPSYADKLASVINGRSMREALAG